MLLQMALFHSFWWLINIPLYVLYIPYLLYPSVSGHLGCFHVLAIVSSAAVNIRVHVFFLFLFLFFFDFWFFFLVFILFLIDLYWSIIASQYCVSFCGTTKWISQMHTYIPISPPSWASLPPSLSHPSRWSQSTELISLCYAAASH